MVVGATEIFDKINAYVRKQYPDITQLSMPYCSLSVDEKGKHYRIQINFLRKGELFFKSAVATADPDTGTVTMYKEGYTWQYWT